MSARLSRSILLVIPLLLLASAVAQAVSRPRAGVPALVKTAPAQILVNAQGMTLYLYTPDKKNQSTCTGGCAKYWPPVLVAKSASVPASMTGITGKFGVARRADGSRQLTFDGAPLYTFIKDKKPGDMTGQGVGGVWWVVVGRGAAITPPTTPRSGYGIPSR